MIKYFYNDLLKLINGLLQPILIITNVHTINMVSKILLKLTTGKLQGKIVLIDMMMILTIFQDY